MTPNIQTLTRLSMIVAMMLLTSCGKVDQQQEELLRPVRYQKVFFTGGDRVRKFSGVAQAGLESRLSFKVAGTVQTIAVQVGDRLKAGQLIAKLDPTDHQLQVQHAEASLQSAQAQMRNAETSYSRVRQLWENRSVSRNELDAARAAFESTSAQVRAFQKQLELARLQLSYCELKAPLAGAIATVDVEANENVLAGQTIVQLSSGTSLEVEVAVPEMLISQVREGQKVEVTFDALPDQKQSARITEVGVSPTGFATTFPVTVRLEQREPNARPGMAAEVAFNFSSKGQKERIVVPGAAVGEDRQGRFVFVVDFGEEEGQGIVRRKAVTIGEMTDEGIEILEGLVDGSLVVTAGVSKLVDGQKVKFLGEEE